LHIQSSSITDTENYLNSFRLANELEDPKAHTGQISRSLLGSALGQQRNIELALIKTICSHPLHDNRHIDLDSEERNTHGNTYNFRAEKIYSMSLSLSPSEWRLISHGS
jgi:sugar diacid utilization regulator